MTEQEKEVEIVPAAQEPLKKEEPKVEPETETEVSSNDKIDRATAVAKRIEDANLKHEELLVRAEQLKVKEILGGKSEVSQKKSEKELKEDEVKEGTKNLIPKDRWQEVGLE